MMDDSRIVVMVSVKAMKIVMMVMTMARQHPTVAKDVIWKVLLW
jgi:hypothetical protein